MQASIYNLHDKIAIIIPTYKRQDYLRRLSNYYENFDFNVYILDSSPEEAKVNLASNIYYIWTPRLSFNQKILNQVEKLKNIPFIALMADDDFVRYETLIDCLHIMEKDNRYVMSNGFQYLFNQDFDKKIYYNPTANGFREVREILNDSDGITYYWKNYQNILWSLFRRDVLLNSFVKLAEQKYDCGNFPELIVSIEVLRNGCVYISESPFNYMEINPGHHWGNTTPSISWPDYLRVKSLRNDIKLFKLSYKNDEHAHKCLKLHMGDPLNEICKYLLRKAKIKLYRMVVKNKSNNTSLINYPQVKDNEMVKRIEEAYNKI